MAGMFYLIEANLYLLICFSAYYFLFKKEAFFELHRLWLLGSALFSFFIPLVSASYFHVGTVADSVSQLLLEPVKQVPATFLPATMADSLPAKASLQIEDVILIIYLIGVLYALIKYIVALYTINRLIAGGKVYKKNRINFVYASNQSADVFSFLNYVFIRQDKPLHRSVLVHEMTHIKQRHSLDTLFLEFLYCFNWFNPLFILLLREVKLNHEFLADQRVIKSYSKRKYAKMLIACASASPQKFAHAAFSITQVEARIRRLATDRLATRNIRRYYFVLPVMVGLLFFSAFKVPKSYGFIQLRIPEKNGVEIREQDIYSEKRHQVPGYSDEPERKQPPATIIPVRAGMKKDQMLSELVYGETTLSKIAKSLGVRLHAIDYWFHWTINEDGGKIRKPVHSILSGTEAQLFRGAYADTLYVDRGFYSLDNDTVTIHTSNFLIGHADANLRPDKNLLIIDAASQRILQRLNRVEIRTKAAITSVQPNPDYGYVRKNDSDSIPAGYVDVKTRDAGRKYIQVGSNARVRMARITANKIITNETSFPAEDPRQPGTLW